jgi:LmbE family N-acetylglucosaminyl deacetylase
MGELGIPQARTDLNPEKMATIRKNEAENMALALGFTLTTLHFPDMKLPFIPMEVLIKHTLPIIRELNTKAIFSFHPYETTRSFDHPDHNIAGLVARHVAAASDVSHFYPHSPAMRERPQLHLWTTEPSLANRRLRLTKKIRDKRSQHLIQHYPSQFQKSERLNWQPIFERITRENTKQHSELYKQVR